MVKNVEQHPATITRKGKVPLASTKNVVNPAEQENLEMDPKGLSSFRGKGVYIGKEYTVDVKGTRALRADKKPVKATWF